MCPIKDAIILAGGRGTRMLPASLYTPKETMPLVDTPIINHLIWEASRAGVSRIHLVLSKDKMRIFETTTKERSLFLSEIRPDLPLESLSLEVDDVKVLLHLQKNPGGVADAMSCALNSISGPFLVLLGDMLLMDSHNSVEKAGPEFASRACADMVSSFNENGLPTVGLYPVYDEQISKFGVVELSGNSVLGIVEKPQPKFAPSEYVLCGRYIFPENTKEILQDYPVSKYGEMQSIRILQHLIEDGGLCAVKFNDMEMYDSGNPMNWLKSQIDHALRRDDLSPELRAWVKHRIENE